MNTRALLVSPLGFLIGLSLGALGGGGSILAVPLLVYGAGQDPKAATASSLLLVGGASLVGVLPHWRAGRVRLGTGVAFGLTGIGGSLLGTLVNEALDPDVLLLGFSVLVLVAAWRMVTGCPSCTRVGEEREVAWAEREDGDPSPGTGGLAMVVRHHVDVARTVRIIAAGTGVGFLTGLFGVGGGFVIVPALTLVVGLNMPTAIGTSLVVISINSAVALMARLATTTVDWGLTLPFAVSAVIGVLVGGRVADRLDARRSLRAFAVLLVGVGVYTGIQAILALI
jgi:uncharacterized membrane protein YfcA